MRKITIIKEAIKRIPVEDHDKLAGMKRTSATLHIKYLGDEAKINGLSYDHRANVFHDNDRKIIPHATLMQIARKAHNETTGLTPSFGQIAKVIENNPRGGSNTKVKFHFWHKK